MKKPLLLLAALLVFSCQSGYEEAQQPSYMGIVDKYEEMLSKTLNNAVCQPLVSVQENKTHYKVRIKVDNIQQSTHTYLSSHYFNGAEYSYAEVPLTQIITATNISARAQGDPTSVLDLVDGFAEAQKKFLKLFIEEMASLDEGNLESGYDVIKSFSAQAVSSPALSNAEKTELLMFAAGAKALIGFVQAGGVKEIGDRLAMEMGGVPVNGRAIRGGCHVDWRGVWAGAVIGLAVGAIDGGIAGATLGTFTVPVLGTAVGGVGGAVFGGAFGYATGALTSIASELLTSCFRGEYEVKGKDRASCEWMSDQGMALPPVCFKYINFKVPVKY